MRPSNVVNITFFSSFVLLPATILFKVHNTFYGINIGLPYLRTIGWYHLLSFSNFFFVQYYELLSWPFVQINLSMAKIQKFQNKNKPSACAMLSLHRIKFGSTVDVMIRQSDGYRTFFPGFFFFNVCVSFSYMKAGKKSHWKWTGFKIHTLSLAPEDILKAKACIAAYNWFFQVKLLSIYSLRWSKWRFEYSTYWQLEADCYSTKMTLMSWFWF